MNGYDLSDLTNMAHKAIEEIESISYADNYFETIRLEAISRSDKAFSYAEKYSEEKEKDYLELTHHFFRDLYVICGDDFYEGAFTSEYERLDEYLNPRKYKKSDDLRISSSLINENLKKYFSKNDFWSMLSGDRILSKAHELHKDNIFAILRKFFSDLKDYHYKSTNIKKPEKEIIHELFNPNKTPLIKVGNDTSQEGLWQIVLALWNLFRNPIAHDEKYEVTEEEGLAILFAINYLHTKLKAYLKG